MKIRRITPVFATLVLSLAASPMWADPTGVWDQAVVGSSVRLHIGYSNAPAASVKGLRLGFEEAGSSPALGFATFDLVHANGGNWEWRWDDNVNGPKDAMALSTSGVLRLWAPVVSSHQPWMDLDATGKIHFGETIGGVESPITTLYYDAPSGTLRLGTATVITSDSLRLTVGAGNGVIGSGSFAGGAGSEVNGASSFAFGTNARVGDLTLTGGVWSTNGAAVNDGVALGNNAYSAATNAMAFGLNSKALQPRSIAIGADAEVTAGSYPGDPYVWGSVALGTKAKAAGINSIALGAGALTEGQDSVAVGRAAIAKPIAVGGTALGMSAIAWAPGSTALGREANAGGTWSAAVGFRTYPLYDYSTVIGQYSEANAQGQVVLGVAPALPPLSNNIDDMDAAVLVVASGKPLPGSGGGSNLNAFNLLRRTAMTVTRRGNVTANAKSGYNRFKTTVLVPASGDIGMGAFIAGEEPDGDEP